MQRFKIHSDLKAKLPTNEKVAYFYNRFTKLYGNEAHFVLACHAAFPIAITVDLLYHIWINFQRLPNSDEVIKIPYEAVSDIMLSSLFEEVYPEMFEMDKEVRNYLLKNLKTHPLYGIQRQQQLARFLIAYSSTHFTKSFQKKLAKSQRVTAVAYLDPELAAQEIIDSFNKHNSANDEGELSRYADLVDTLEVPLAQLPELVTYSKALNAELSGKSDIAAKIISKSNLSNQLGKTDEPIRIAGKILIVNERLKQIIKEKIKVLYPREEDQKLLIPQKVLQRILKAGLSNAKKIDLSGFRLSYLPRELFELIELEELDISNNNLSVISEDILRLRHLKRILIKGNPLISPPIEIINRGISAMTLYFNDQKQEGVIQINEAKLLLIGEGGVGKTTLGNKIIDSNYQINSNEHTTDGIDIMNYSFKKNDGGEIKVNIWDFGGQEIYHATHQFFLTNRSFYLLVTDYRREDFDLNYWLSVQALLGGDSPVLIIQNEKMDRKKNLNKTAIQEKFPNVKGFLQTNLKNNRGLTEIIERIEKEIESMDHIGDELPKNWVEIRQELETYNNSYISLNEYFSVCQRHGLIGKKSALILSSYLHDLGIILHFQEDSILKETIFLNNEWCTDAIYKVIDYPKLRANLGKFTFNDLMEIWYEPQYSDKQMELVALMKKFKLCFQIPNSQNYIAPSLLPIDKTYYEWNDENNIRLQYSYEFMPKGILTRFIVETYQYIKNQDIVWKTGVVLAENDINAEILEIYGQSKVQIKIEGDSYDLLLCLIMKQIEAINESFHNLKVDKLIPCNCESCTNDKKPTFFKEEALLIRKEHNKYEIECQKAPYYSVNILNLLNSFSTKNLELKLLLNSFKKTLFNNKTSNEQIGKAWKELIEIINNFPKESKKLHSEAIQIAHDYILEGNENFNYLNDIFETYRLCIDKSLLVENGVLSLGFYLHIIRVAISINNTNWANNFITKYSVLFKESNLKEKIELVSKSLILFGRGNYGEVLENYATNKKIKHIELEIVFRALVIQCCFELQKEFSSKLVLDECKSFAQFIRRNKVLPQKRKRKYIYFTSIVQRLANQKSSIEKIKKDLFENTYNYLWLKEKIGELITQKRKNQDKLHLDKIIKTIRKLKKNDKINEAKELVIETIEEYDINERVEKNFYNSLPNKEITSLLLLGLEIKVSKEFIRRYLYDYLEQELDIDGIPFVIKAWLDNGGDKEFIQRFIYGYLEDNLDKDGAPFVIRAWLDNRGDKEFIQRFIYGYLEDNLDKIGAPYVIKAWLDSGGDKEFIQRFIYGYLEDNLDKDGAPFVIRAWLDNRGDKEFIQRFIYGYLEDNLAKDGTPFVIRAWLDSGGDKEFIQSYIFEYLEQNISRDESPFVIRAWLDNKGDKEFIQHHIFEYLENHLSKKGTPFVFTAWLENNGDKEVIEKYVLEFLQSNSNTAGVSSIIKAWLVNKGDKEIIKPFLLEFLRNNPHKKSISFLLKAWLDKKGDKSIIKPFLVRFLKRNNKEPASQSLVKLWIKEGGSKQTVLPFVNIRAIILDDESYNIKVLKQELRKIAPFIKVIGEAKMLSKSEELIDSLKPDIVFTDIYKGRNRVTIFRLLEKYDSINFGMVVVSATPYENGKVIKRLFRYNMIDYICKPHLNQHLTNSLSVITDYYLGIKDIALSSHLKNYYLKVKTKDKSELIDHQSIHFIETAQEKTFIHLDDGKKIQVLNPFIHLKDSLDNIVDFFIVKESCIVNMSKVKYYSKSKLELFFLNNRVIYVSKEGEEIFNLLDMYPQSKDIESRIRISKILFLSANPDDKDSLQTEKELTKIKESLKTSTHREKIVLSSEKGVTIPKITKAMQVQNPTIIHFAGFGAGEEGIIVEDEAGKSVKFPNSGLKRLFKNYRDSVKCVVLNACYSKEQARVISKYGIYVVGMNDVISDKSAIDFAVGFYQSIGEGNDIPFSFDMAMVNNSVNIEEANVPELWLDGKLIKK